MIGCGVDFMHVQQHGIPHVAIISERKVVPHNNPLHGQQAQQVVCLTIVRGLVKCREH